MLVEYQEWTQTVLHIATLETRDYSSTGLSYILYYAVVYF